MNEFSFACTIVRGKEKAIGGMLDQLGYQGRHSFLFPIIGIDECSEEEARDLFSLAINLKNQWYIRGFTIVWRDSES